MLKWWILYGSILEIFQHIPSFTIQKLSLALRRKEFCVIPTPVAKNGCPPTHRQAGPCTPFGPKSKCQQCQSQKLEFPISFVVMAWDNMFLATTTCYCDQYQFSTSQSARPIWAWKSVLISAQGCLICLSLLSFAQRPSLWHTNLQEVIVPSYLLGFEYIFLNQTQL
jgi:hypothetical protein